MRKSPPPTPLLTQFLSLPPFATGTTTNVIPDKAVLKGTMRDYNPDVGATMLRRMREVVAGVAAAYDVAFDIDAVDGYPSIINAEEPTAMMTSLCRKYFPDGKVPSRRCSCTLDQASATLKP